jgi:hypothetical protein
MRIDQRAGRMKRIVERCPSCGVEHDEQVHECEACGSAVRHWCRTHSGEVGWLESRLCVRCEEEEALPAPPFTARPPPTPSRGRAARRPPERPRVTSVPSVLLPDGGLRVRPSRPRGWREPAALEWAHVLVERGIANALRATFRIVIVLMIVFSAWLVYQAEPYENTLELAFNGAVGGAMLGLLMAPFVIIANELVQRVTRWWRERSDG